MRIEFFFDGPCPRNSLPKIVSRPFDEVIYIYINVYIYIYINIVRPYVAIHGHTITLIN